MLNRIRDALTADRFARRLSGEIGMDDTYYGGHRKGKRGRGAAGKTPVVGIRQRGGRIRSLMVPALDAQTIQTLVRQHVRRGSGVYTDGLNIYHGLHGLGYRHATVDHSQRFAENPAMHTQDIESHWEHTKPALKARYQKISPAHLPKYLAEANFKRNTGSDPDFIGLVLGRPIIDSCIANGTPLNHLRPHPPLSPATGERIKVRGSDGMAWLHYLCRAQ